MDLLRVMGCSKAFGGVNALANFSVSMPGEQVVAIIGPNGAGKTTLLNVVTGFVRPDSGKCLVGKDDVTGWPPYLIAQCGVSRTFQRMRPLNSLTVLENVVLACPEQQGETLLGAIAWRDLRRQEEANRSRCYDLLKSVGLSAQADRPADELSFGQQKLLSLVRCLATEPRVLLLDEPVSGLQPDMAERVLGLFAEVSIGGRLVVFVEHDIAAVRRAADQVVVMDAGKIIAHGKPDEILVRPEILEAYVS